MTNPLPAASLAGKRAIVTGSSRGVGADTVRYLAAAGAKVVVNFRNKEARATKLVAELEAAGGTAIAIGADLTDPASVAGNARHGQARPGAAWTSSCSMPRAAWKPAWRRTTRCS